MEFMKYNSKLLISKDFRQVLAIVLKNHVGLVVNPAKLPDTLEDVQNALAQAGYIATFEIAMALYLAFKEYKPLLLEGEAGTGKTFLAESVAKTLKFPIHRIQCYEGITYETIVGHWDFQKQLLAMRSTRKQESRDVYTMEYFRKGRLLNCFAEESDDNVLLIDEFDKSDSEFENFFLEYLGERQVTVPELGTIGQKNKTYVFLTSNQMRSFSEPLLRRCLYIWIDYPDKETEFRIIQANVPEAEIEIIRQVVELVHILRTYDLEKKPSPTEAIEFVRGLLKIERIEINFVLSGMITRKMRIEIPFEFRNTAFAILSFFRILG